MIAFQEPGFDDRVEAFVSSWQQRVASDSVLHNYREYDIYSAELPFVFFIHGEGFKNYPGAERLGQDLNRALRDVVRRFDEWIAEPLGREPAAAEGLHAVWITADRSLFSWSLPLLGVRDRRLHTACFSKTERCVFALADATGYIAGDGLAELRHGCARALLDGLGSKGLAAARSQWLTEGLAWLIATGGESVRSALWREDCERFLGADEADLDAVQTLFAGPDSVPVAIAGDRGASGAASAMRDAAAHAVVGALFFGEESTWRATLLDWVQTELDGGPAEELPARALGLRGPRALIDLAREHLRKTLIDAAGAPQEAMPDPAMISPRLPFLVMLAALDLDDAERQARRDDAAPEVQAVAILRRFIERLGKRLREEPEVVLIEEDGRRKKRRAVGTRADRFLISGATEGPIQEIPAGRVGAQLVSLARRAGMSDPEDHLALSLLGALWGDRHLERRERRECETGAERLTDLLAGWHDDLPELAAYRKLASLLVDDTRRCIDATRRAREAFQSTATWMRAKRPVELHLRKVIRSTLGSIDEVLAERFPGARWDEAMRRVTLEYDFSRDRQLGDFDWTGYDALAKAFDYLADRSSGTATLTAGSLEMTGKVFGRHRLWMSSPVDVTLRRAFHGRTDKDELGKGYLGPVLLIGMLDDSEGSFIAVERSFRLVDVRHGRIDALARCPAGHVEALDRDRFHTMRVQTEDRGATAWIDGQAVLRLERGLPLGGRIFLQTAGSGSLRFDDLVISGRLDARAEELLRDDVVEERVGAVLGGED